MDINLSDSAPLLGLDSTIWGAIIGAVATMAVAATSAWVVIYQIGQQIKGAIEQNRHNERMKLKVRVYEDIILACQKSQDANIELTNYARLFLSGVQIARSVTDAGGQALPPVERYPRLLELQSIAQASAIEFIFFIERWGIIDPRLEVFKTAFNAAIFDVRRIWNAYSAAAMALMPVENPQTKEVIRWNLLDDSTMSSLSAITTQFCDAVGTVGAYASDFQLETQNLLLAELFGNKVAPREPLDPSLKVITLDEADRLKSFLENETAWGRDVQATLSRVKAEIEARRAASAAGGESLNL